MRLHVDKEADALYLRLDDSKIIESEDRLNENGKADGTIGEQALEIAP